MQNLDTSGWSLELWTRYIDTWERCENGAPTEAYPSLDALDHSVHLDADTLDATTIDPVGYHEIDACASLDDEIDSLDR